MRLDKEHYPGEDIPAYKIHAGFYPVKARCGRRVDVNGIIFPQEEAERPVWLQMDSNMMCKACVRYHDKDVAEGKPEFSKIEG